MPYLLQRIAALVVLLPLLPLLVVVSLAIRMVDGSPILFRQQRVGRDCAQFSLLKFRTMKNGADLLLLQGSDPSGRLTRLGPILRKTGIDEIPQFLNVIRGEMAVVGPRAMLPKVAENLPDAYSRRFSVLPGITGLAQVSGRNSIPWSKRLDLDVKYADTRSPMGDMRIALRTIGVLVSGAGHSPDRNTSSVDDLGLLK